MKNPYQGAFVAIFGLLLFIKVDFYYFLIVHWPIGMGMYVISRKAHGCHLGIIYQDQSFHKIIGHPKLPINLLIAYVIPFYLLCHDIALNYLFKMFLSFTPCSYFHGYFLVVNQHKKYSMDKAFNVFQDAFYKSQRCTIYSNCS